MEESYQDADETVMEDVSIDTVSLLDTTSEDEIAPRTSTPTDPNDQSWPTGATYGSVIASDSHTIVVPDSPEADVDVSVVYVGRVYPVYDLTVTIDD